MIAVDTNILVYAHRLDSPFNQPSYDSVRGLAEGAERWAIPWPCLSEFLAIVTNPGIYREPTSTMSAISQVETWLDSPSVVPLSEGPGFWKLFSQLLAEAKVAGGRVHDARVAALCLHHGIDELWTADRDFGRFPQLRVRNPLIGD